MTSRVTTWRKTKGITYSSWRAMIERCGSQTASRGIYREITVCPEWRDYARFVADMGERPSRDHSIDRIDGTKGYEPGNCRWTTRKEQQANLRSNRVLEVNGESLHLSEWARRLGVSPQVIYQRLRNGWPVERAVTAKR